MDEVQVPGPDATDEERTRLQRDIDASLAAFENAMAEDPKPPSELDRLGAVAAMAEMERLYGSDIAVVIRAARVLAEARAAHKVAGDVEAPRVIVNRLAAAPEAAYEALMELPWDTYRERGLVEITRSYLRLAQIAAS